MHRQTCVRIRVSSMVRLLLCFGAPYVGGCAGDHLSLADSGSHPGVVVGAPTTPRRAPSSLDAGASQRKAQPLPVVIAIGNAGQAAAPPPTKSASGVAGQTGGATPQMRGGRGASGTAGTVAMQPSPGQASDDAGVTFAAGVNFTAAEVALYRTLSPLPAVPSDPTNAHADDPAAASLGQMLYFDTSYSGPLEVASDLGNVGDAGKIACFTCHWGPYLDDQRSISRNVSLGADYHSRNAPTTINSAFYRWSNWGGRFSAQWELPLAVAESGVIMNSSRLEVAHLIFDKYRTQYEAVFGAIDDAVGSDASRFPAKGKPKPAPTTATPSPPDGSWELMTDADRAAINLIFVNYGKALEAYVRLLVSRNAPFDVFVSGKNDAIGDDAKRGLKLFLGRARCSNCHLGPHFSDDAFHNLGVPQTGANVPASDDGRFKDIPALLASPFSSATQYSDDATTGRLLGLTNPPPTEAKGQFRTPSLRGVAQTAPYMHSGQLATLEDVIDFHDQGGQAPVSGAIDPLLVPLGLSAQDKADLLAFLRTLTGEDVPGGLMMATSAPWP